MSEHSSCHPTPVVGLGAGGHARVMIDILQLAGGYELVGLLDPRQEIWHTNVLGIPVIGDDALLPDLYRQDIHAAFIGLGTTGATTLRQQLYEKAVHYGFQIVQAVHPQAIVAPSAKIGDGVTIAAGAIVNAAAQLGMNVIINTGAIVEHDCIIGNHVHIATGARLASTVHIENGAHIGIGATVRQCIHIGCNAIVGAGAVVIDDVPDFAVVVGVPARVLRKIAR
jgi:sugar O-acyltransferase (sialic acid O-acetyltransferase NeuD family)